MAANSLPNLSSLINSLTVPLENLLEEQLKAIAVFQEILSSNPPKKRDENLLRFHLFFWGFTERIYGSKQEVVKCFKKGSQVAKRETRSSQGGTQPSDSEGE
jgi:hypothetical protein